jgi:hypothetical protein
MPNKILIRQLEEKKSLGAQLGIDGRIILKQILQK